MELKKLLKLESLKNFHRANNLFILISLVWISLSFLEKDTFSDELFITTLVKFIYLFVIFSIYIIFMVNKEVKNQVIIKNFADGLSRQEYFMSKIIWLIINVFVYVILSIMLIIGYFFLQKNAIGYEIEYSGLYYVLSFSNIIALFLGFLYFGILGMMYMLLIRNSIIAILVLIGQFIFEHIIWLININTIKLNISYYLPSLLIKNLIKYSDFDWISGLILVCYIILFGFIVRKRIIKIN